MRVEHAGFAIGVAMAVSVSIAVAVFLKNDLELPAGGQLHAFAQPAFAAKRIEHARDRAGVLPEFSGFAFEAVNFFNDFNRYQDRVFLETEQGIGVMKENVCVENIVFHLAVGRY